MRKKKNKTCKAIIYDWLKCCKILADFLKVLVVIILPHCHLNLHTRGGVVGFFSDKIVAPTYILRLASFISGYRFPILASLVLVPVAELMTFILASNKMCKVTAGITPPPYYIVGHSK